MCFGYGGMYSRCSDVQADTKHASSRIKGICTTTMRSVEKYACIHVQCVQLIAVAIASKYSKYVR